MVKVSVIIPIYNAEKYLGQCLDSLCAQTLHEIEIICVDDGSTDGTAEILGQYVEKDSRVKALHQQNRYAGVARNTGMSCAKGKYLSFLDADDFFEKDFLEKMYAAAEENDSDIVICRVNYYDDINESITPREIEEELIYLPENVNCFNWTDMPKHLFQISNGWAWDKLFKTEFINRLGIRFQPYRVANDGFFVYAALARAERITKIDDFLVNQRRNNGQSLSNTREKTWHCGFDMIYAIRDYLMGEGIYARLKQTFLNFAMKYVIWSFEGMKSWKVKGNIYDAIREELIPALEMEALGEEYFYDKLYGERYQYILEHTYDDYISGLLEQKQRSINSLKRNLQVMTQRCENKIWPFPYHLIPKASRIVLYGAGAVGKDYYKQACESGYCEVVLWMDKQFADKTTEGTAVGAELVEIADKNRTVCGWLTDLGKCSYDMIVVSVRNEAAVREIVELLIENNVPEDKIVAGIR